MRQIARDRNAHASTVLRQIRRIEDAIDNPLIALYIERYDEEMDDRLTELALLTKKGVVVAAADGMAMAVIVSKNEQRLGAVPALTVSHWLVNGWIEEVRRGRIMRYKITLKGAGRVEDASVTASNTTATNPEKPLEVPRRRRVQNESPIDVLARRKNREGKPYVSPEEVHAAHRLYEDFVQAQQPHHRPATMNWDQIADKVDRCPHGNIIPGSWYNNGTAGQFEKALKYVGLGLADILLLCVCYEYGLEQCEKRLGWSARSGKVVLSIALGRLVDFYKQDPDDLIG